MFQEGTLSMNVTAKSWINVQSTEVSCNNIHRKRRTRDKARNQDKSLQLKSSTAIKFSSAMTCKCNWEIHNSIIWFWFYFSYIFPMGVSELFCCIGGIRLTMICLHFIFISGLRVNNMPRAYCIVVKNVGYKTQYSEFDLRQWL